MFHPLWIGFAGEWLDSLSLFSNQKGTGGGRGTQRIDHDSVTAPSFPVGYLSKVSDQA